MKKTFRKGDVVYISGPMTGIEDFNKPAFNAAAARLQKEVGCKVLNPARHQDGFKYSEYMRLAVVDLLQATKVFVLPGWAQSSGSVFELNMSEMLEIPRFFQVEFEQKNLPNTSHNVKSERLTDG